MQISRRHFLLGATAATLCAQAWPLSPAPPRIRQDWHMHTHRAGGKDDAVVSAMIEKNATYGLDLMGISEHIDRLDQREEFIGHIAANRRELAEAEWDTPMNVMIGTEASMLSPMLCCLEEDVAQTLDYVLVSCNHYHLKVVENPPRKTPEAYAEHYLDMLEGAIALGFVDTIGHPFLHMKLHKDLGMEKLQAVLKLYKEDRLARILAEAAKIHMAFEINPHHADLALDWFRELVQEARRHGTRFTLGTDAHELASLGFPAREGRTAEAVLADLGITNEDLKWTAKRGPRAHAA